MSRSLVGSSSSSTDVYKRQPERIDMELTVRTQTLKLRCASFDANMKGIDAASFPIIPTIDGVTGGGENNGATTLHIELPSTGLRKMVDQVVFAASTDESRPTLTGVEVTFKAVSYTHLDVYKRQGIDRGIRGGYRR